jgi:predicted metal-dependent enzyme (double-stranded beta helix superfamily)
MPTGPDDKKLLPAFEKFIRDLRTIWAGTPDDETRMKKAHRLMEDELLPDPELQAHCRNWPSTEGRKNLLFYTDPDYGFVINGVVRAPGRTGSVHDHADAWVLYGLLDGRETLERFERVDDGSREGHAEVRLTSANRGEAGKADLVRPYNIHAEQGSDIRSVAVILRSSVLVGRVPQGRYDRDTHKYSTGMGPEQIPYELTA